VVNSEVLLLNFQTRKLVCFMDHKKQNFLVRHATVLKVDEVKPRTLKSLKSIGAIYSFHLPGEQLTNSLKKKKFNYCTWATAVMSSVRV